MEHGNYTVTWKKEKTFKWIPNSLKWLMVFYFGVILKKSHQSMFVCLENSDYKSTVFLFEHMQSTLKK